MKTLTIIQMLLAISIIRLSAIGLNEPLTVNSVNNQYVSARIITIDGNVLSGVVQFGVKQISSNDVFNAYLTTNRNANSVPEQFLKERQNYSEKTISWYVGIPIQKRTLVSYQPPFQCSFGFIKYMEVKEREVVLSLINNQQFSLDIGKGIFSSSVFLSNIGQSIQKVKWCDIKSVEFIKTNEDNAKLKGDVLFGTVETTKGSFTGTITWDMQEHYESDIFNGRTSDKTKKILFKNIVSIENTGDDCDVELSNGDRCKLSPVILELFTEYGNDIGSENRGICITNNQIGSVTIKWKDFKKVSFQKITEISLANVFSSEKIIKKNYASVVSLEEKILTGDIIFNMYKELNIQYLGGYDFNGFLYEIPFSLIKAIRKNNKASAIIMLTNNQLIELTNSLDFGDQNDGLLVITDKVPSYLPWSNIKEINFSL